MPTAWFHVTTDVSVGATGPIPVNAWTHLATTFDGAQLKVFVNGVLAGTQALSGKSRRPRTAPCVSAATRSGTNTSPAGSMKSEIFNRVLTESEIQADMIGRSISRPVGRHASTFRTWGADRNGRQQHPNRSGVDRFDR